MSNRDIAVIYRRMLAATGLQGRVLTRRSGPPVHVVSSGDGPPVVHLHGSNTSALSHLMLAERARGLRSHLVDRPGFGLSEPEAFRPGAFREHGTRFVGDVLDALDLESPILVGASAGGSWATWFALAHPERVGGLVLLGAMPTLPGARPPLPLRVAATRGPGDLMHLVKPGRGMVLRMMASMGEDETILRYPDLLDSLVAGARDPITSRVNLAELRALISARGIRRSIFLTRDELHAVAVPTMVICGDRDPVLPLAHARAAAAEISEARLEVLHAGHVPQLGHPDRVAQLVGEFARAA